MQVPFTSNFFRARVLVSPNKQGGFQYAKHYMSKFLSLRKKSQYGSAEEGVVFQSPFRSGAGSDWQYRKNGRWHQCSGPAHCLA